MKSRLADYAVTLRRLDARFGKYADAIGAVIRDLDCDGALDVADQMRRIADKLEGFAEGMTYDRGICCSCLDSEWSHSMQHDAAVRGVAEGLVKMSKQQIGRAA